MIQILGFKRVLTLAVLAAVCAVLAGALYYVVIPQKTKAENELRVTRAAVGTRRNEVATLKTEYEQFRSRKPNSAASSNPVSSEPRTGSGPAA